MQPMIVSFTSHLRLGYDFSVGKSRGGARKLVLHRKLDGAKITHNLQEAQYEELMLEIVSWLAKRHRRWGGVEIKMDFYGTQWIEVHWRFIGLHRSRLGLSPRFIAMLSEELVQSESEPVSA